MTDLFGHDDLTATARRAPAPGPPSSFSESLSSSFEITTEQGRSISANEALFNAYDAYLKEVEERSGVGLPNPFQHDPVTRPKVEALVLEEIRKLREKDPEVPLRDIRAEIGRDRAAARERRAEVERREIGFGPNAGAFLGTAGAIMTDPPVFASMFFGAPWATGLLRAAVVEAGAAGAGETLAQVGVQLGRRQFGEEPDLGEAALAVATVAGGAGVLAPVVRGGAAGVRALLKRAEKVSVKGSLARAAERFLRRQVDLEDASPFPETARAEHAERLTEAQVALREGRPVRMPEQPRATIREDVPKATPASDFGDDEIGRLATSGAADTGVRGRATVGSPLPAGAALPPPPRPAARRVLDEGVEPDTPAARAEDDALEARVRAMAEAEPNARVTIEDGETVRAMTARELVQEIDDDRSFLSAIQDCLRAA